MFVIWLFANIYYSMVLLFYYDTFL